MRHLLWLKMGTSTTNDQVLHLGLDLTVPEVIDLQVQNGHVKRHSSWMFFCNKWRRGPVLRWEVEETVFAPLVDRIVTARNLRDE